MEDELENYGSNEVKDTHGHVVFEIPIADDICQIIETRGCRSLLRGICLRF